MLAANATISFKPLTSAEQKIAIIARKLLYLYGWQLPTALTNLQQLSHLFIGMTYGKTIRLFLVEGTTNGMITAELSNWTGKAFKIPRIKIKDYLRREELHKSGVYILLARNQGEQGVAYIGEGEPVIERIKNHDIKKDFWNEVIIFTSKDDYLNKASIKYLENRLYTLANTSRRYDISVQNIPTQSAVSEAEKAELEEFLSNIKLLTATLGHNIFEEIIETVDIKENHGNIFFCKNTSGIVAKGSPSTEGFVVFRGSKCLSSYHSSLPESIRNERNKMIEAGQLVMDGESLTLTTDYVFGSPSRAAAMVLGRSARGPIEWKTENGITLTQFEDQNN